MRVVAEHVDDRHAVDGRHPLDHTVVEHPRREHGVIAGHHPGDVLDRLADVEADLLAAGVHRVPTELHDGHLHRLAGAVRRLLEDQGDAEAGERRGEDRFARRGAAPAPVPRGEVGDVEQMCVIAARRRPSRPPRRSPPSVTVSGGARRSDVARDGVGDEAAVEQLGVDGLGVTTVGQLGGRAAARARARWRSPGSSLEPGREVLAPLGGQTGRVDAAHLVDHRADDRRGERRAAVGAAVVARLEHRGDLALGPRRTDGEAVAHRLGHASRHRARRRRAGSRTTRRCGRSRSGSRRSSAAARARRTARGRRAGTDRRRAARHPRPAPARAARRRRSGRSPPRARRCR